MSAIRLTPAQVSAIECRPLDEEEAIIARCWQGGRLVFAPADREALYVALNEASNAEDADAGLRGDKFARRAASSLATLAAKVLRAA